MVDPEDSCASLEEGLARVQPLGPMVPSGVLARGLVHELKNRLNPVGLQLELLRRRAGDDPKVTKLIESLKQSMRELDAMLNVTHRFALGVVPPDQDDAAIAESMDLVCRGLRGEPEDGEAGEGDAGDAGAG